MQKKKQKIIKLKHLLTHSPIESYSIAYLGASASATEGARCKKENTATRSFGIFDEM